MADVASIAGFVGGIAFTVLTALLIGGHLTHPIGRLLTLACAVSAAWLAALGLYYTETAQWLSISWVSALEVLRNAAWFVACVQST